MNRVDFRQALVKAHGEAFTFSYFDRSEWEPGAPNVLHPWSKVARGRFMELAGNVLKDCNVRIGTNAPWRDRW